MAPKLLKAPLVASVKERLKADGQKLKLHRIAPPTATRIASVHLLPVSEPPEVPEMAGKKKIKQKRYDAEFKARVVARALKARESGEETIGAVAKAEGTSEQIIYTWIKQAKASNGASPVEASAKPGRKSAGDLKSITRELSEAMDRVSKLKKQMRKLLGDD